MPKSLAAFAAEQPVRRGPDCTIGRSKHRKAIEAGLRDGIAATTIARWLRSQYGVEVKPITINRHRKRDCRCG